MTFMRRLRRVGLAVALVFGCLSTAAFAQAYEGAEYCGGCHPGIYNEWKVSGHPYKLVKAADAMVRPIPLPEGYTWDDISYVIGGYKWKSRYMGTDGYIITTVRTDDGDVPGMNQYNMLTDNWVDYHPGEMKPYDCGRCHTTGFSPEGNQDGLPGIIGTWAFGGIQCEECHGPGFAGHFTDEHIDRSSEACGKCHIRGEPTAIPASSGFVRHHEQYNELLASPHENLNCVSCHNPHKKGEFSIVRECELCHGDIAASYAGTEMEVRNVECIDCHMPFAAKSAEALGPFLGDVRSHLFSINTSADGQMFTEDGKFVLLDGEGKGQLSLDFSCRTCHPDRTVEWYAEYAMDFHGEDGDDDDDDDAKVCFCHIPPGNPNNAHTICVGMSAAGAHFGHGDTEGSCDGDSAVVELEFLGGPTQIGASQAGTREVTKRDQGR